MKVLLIHNYYSQGGGGEDSVFEAEAGLLRAHGHEVLTFVRSNKEVLDQGKLCALKMLFRSKFNRRIYSEVRALCEEARPDVAHVHNFWFALSPSVHAACRDAGVPVVQTLHNFRLVCLNAMLVRCQKICDKCVGNSAWAGVRLRCYHHSFLKSWFVRRVAAQRDRLLRNVDLFVALTEHGKSIFKRAGFPDSCLTVKPHAVEDVSNSSLPVAEDLSALYVGRVSEEKGILTLCAAWKAQTSGKLVLLGDGPLKKYVSAWASTIVDSTVVLKGVTDKEGVFEEMSKASFLILPSECYETFGLVMVESFSAGRPVIASRHGAMAEIVTDGQTGLLFEPGNAKDLAEKIEWMFSHPDECRRMGENARKEYEKKYSPEKNYDMLIEVYKSAIARHSSCREGGGCA